MSTNDEFCIKTRNCAFKNDEFCRLLWHHISALVLKFPRAVQVSKSDEFRAKNEELCIKNEGFCIQNKGFYIQNKGFCIQNEVFCI